MIVIALLVFTLLIDGTIGTHEELRNLITSDPSFSIKFPGIRKFPEDFRNIQFNGHLEQLGKQRPPLGQVPEYFEAPSPRFLWENHVKLYRPALFRGLLRGSPAIPSWSDKYVIEKYGDLEVLVEKKFEDRKTEPKRMTIKSFLESYQERNWYIVTILPNRMKEDIKVPKPLMCSTFKKKLQELNLWIGTHGTRSMLHYDADNILHCLVAGRKNWILIHPHNKFRADMGLNNPGQGSGFSLLNVDSINLQHNPDVVDIPWEYASLYAGDCIYIPPQYMHQVRSYNRSISVTFLFYPDHQFDDDDCNGIDLNSYQSLKDTYVFWGYEKGQETVDMGYKNPLELKTWFLAMCNALDLSALSWKQFLYIYASLGDEVLVDLYYPRSIFSTVDANKDNFVSLNELQNVDTELWKEICRKNESPHGPTKSDVSEGDAKLTNLVADFNPRSHNHYAESRKVGKLLLLVLDRFGENGSLPFHRFKKLIAVTDGSIAVAFVLLDADMDGILTKVEVQSTPKEFLKKIYSMRLDSKAIMKETGFLLRDEAEESEEEPEYVIILNSLSTVIDDMEAHNERTISQEKFQSLLKTIRLSNVEVSVDSKFIFKLLDEDNDGFLSVDDLRYIQAARLDSNKSAKHMNPQEDEEEEGIRMAKQQSLQTDVPREVALLEMFNSIVLVESLTSDQADPSGLHEEL